MSMEVVFPFLKEERELAEKKIIVNLMELGFLITLYAVSDIIAWGQFLSFAISHQMRIEDMQGLYNTLWFLELDSLILVGLFWTRSLAVPALLWLYNYLSVESLFYYVFQGKLPPYNMPWLNLGTSTNLYTISAIFAVVSILLIWGEIETKNLLKRATYHRKVPNKIDYISRGEVITNGKKKDNTEG